MCVCMCLGCTATCATMFVHYRSVGMSSSDLSTFEYTANDNTCQNHLLPELCNFKYFNCTLSFVPRIAVCLRVSWICYRNQYTTEQCQCQRNVNQNCSFFYRYSHDRAFQMSKCILWCRECSYSRMIWPVFGYPCHTKSTFNLCFISIWCQELWHKIRPMRQ